MVGCSRLRDSGLGFESLVRPHPIRHHGCYKIISTTTSHYQNVGETGRMYVLPKLTSERGAITCQMPSLPMAEDARQHGVSLPANRPIDKMVQHPRFHRRHRNAPQHPHGGTGGNDSHRHSATIDVLHRVAIYWVQDVDSFVIDAPTVSAYEDWNMLEVGPNFSSSRERILNLNGVRQPASLKMKLETNFMVPSEDLRFGCCMPVREETVGSKCRGYSSRTQPSYSSACRQKEMRLSIRAVQPVGRDI